MTEHSSVMEVETWDPSLEGRQRPGLNPWLHKTHSRLHTCVMSPCGYGWLELIWLADEYELCHEKMVRVVEGAGRICTVNSPVRTRGGIFLSEQSVSAAAQGVTATADEGSRSQILTGGVVVDSVCRVVVTHG